MSLSVRNWLKVRFIAGFFVTVPAFLTAWLLWIFWSRIDDVFAPMYQRILGRDIPGLGFLTAVGTSSHTSRLSKAAARRAPAPSPPARVGAPRSAG